MEMGGDGTEPLPGWVRMGMSSVGIAGDGDKFLHLSVPCFMLHL